MSQKGRPILMKKRFNYLLLCCVAVLPVLFAGCTPINKNYGVSSDFPSNPTVSYPENVAIPTIKSTDTVMPIYFDISLYDEENYSQIYLGKKYKFNATYDGEKIDVPTTIKELNKKGWNIAENERYSTDSTIKAGTTLELQLINDNNKLMTAYFYNKSNTSVQLVDCKIVRLAIEQNTKVTNSSDYGLFNVNGVNNNSVLTDVFQSLGAPSHFHADTKTDYTLDWFKSADDRRNKITVKISTQNDCVTYVAISNYK